jgi:predicted MFS family arabinose efflux permease
MLSIESRPVPAPPSDAGAPGGHRPWTARIASALAHRNFRLVWTAALISTIGTWMQGYAQSWLVFDLTRDTGRSNFFLGLDTVFGQLPILLFMLVGGVVADRHDRRRLLTLSQYVQATAAFTLALLVFTGTVEVWAIFLLSFIAGTGQAFGGPAYQALLPSLVPRQDLPNALALNSTQFNLSRALGPVVGGLVLGGIGAAWCFTLNGLSFFAVVVALASLRVPAHVPQTAPRALTDELRSGLSYVRRERLLLVVTVFAFVTTFLANPLATLLPSFATTMPTGGGSPERRLAVLMACQGAGAIIGALVVGSLGRFRHMGRAVLGVHVGLGLAIVGFAMAPAWTTGLALLVLVGVCSMAMFSMSLSLLQLTAPDALRGRIISIYMVALRSGWPLGALVAGLVADVAGAANVMVVNGLLLVAMGTLFLARRRGTLYAA